jgi:hypothetical protein
MWKVQFAYAPVMCCWERELKGGLLQGVCLCSVYDMCDTSCVPPLPAMERAAVENGVTQCQIYTHPTVWLM